MRRRLPRILLNAATAVSLLLCLTMAALWVHSRARHEGVARGQLGVSDHYQINLWYYLGVEEGRIRWVRQESRYPVPPGSEPTPPVRWGQDGYYQSHWTWRPLEFFRPSDYMPRGSVPVEHVGPVYWSVDTRGGAPMQLTEMEVGAPCWVAVLAFGLMTVALASTSTLRRLRRKRHQRPGRCQTCGYDLRATPVRCPECGTVPAA